MVGAPSFSATFSSPAHAAAVDVGELTEFGGVSDDPACLRVPREFAGRL